MNPIILKDREKRKGWTAEDGVMTGYDVTVPANTTATRYLQKDYNRGKAMNQILKKGRISFDRLQELCYDFPA